MRTRGKVVFVGGGYTTVHAYAALVRGRRRAVERGDLQIVVITADDHHSYHGLTGEVLARVLPLEVTRTSLRRIMPLAAVVHARVTHVDPDRRTVTFTRIEDGAVETIGYDEIVIAAGGREPVDVVPGMVEHGFTLRHPGDLSRLLRRLALLEHPSAQGGRGDLVVVGGGLAGVELAAALASRPTSHRGRRVLLIHGGPQLLPHLRATQPGLARRAERELARLGVEVHCDVRVATVHEHHAVLTDGIVLRAALVLATTGQRPVALDGLEGLPHDDAGRLVTGDDLTVAPGVWSAGDAARVRHPRTGEPVPANALWALKAGDHLGRNLRRHLRSRPTRPFGYRGLGQAASFGVGRGIAELYGVPITGRLAWVTRLAFFLRFMPSRTNAVETVACLVAGSARRGGAAPDPSPSIARARSWHSGHAAVSTAGSVRRLAGVDASRADVA